MVKMGRHPTWPQEKLVERNSETVPLTRLGNQKKTFSSYFSCETSSRKEVTESEWLLDAYLSLMIRSRRVEGKALKVGSGFRRNTEMNEAGLGLYLVGGNEGRPRTSK